MAHEELIARAGRYLDMQVFPGDHHSRQDDLVRDLRKALEAELANKERFYLVMQAQERALRDLIARGIEAYVQAPMVESIREALELAVAVAEGHTPANPWARRPAP